MSDDATRVEYEELPTMQARTACMVCLSFRYITTSGVASHVGAPSWKSLQRESAVLLGTVCLHISKEQALLRESLVGSAWVTVGVRC